MDATRSRWAELVRRWRRSGQTAREFAESAGINAGTLSHWAWRLRRKERERDEGAVKRRRRRRSSAARRERGFVELIVDRHEDGRFELELGDGRRLRIPSGFDPVALGRLLTALEHAHR